MNPTTLISWHELARVALVSVGSVALRLVPMALAAAGFLTVLRIRRPAVRHVTWTIVLAGLLALPLLQWIAPPLSLGVSRAHTLRLVNAAPALAPALLPREAPSIPSLGSEEPNEARRFDPVTFAAIVWVLIALAGLGRMAFGLWTAHKLADEAAAIFDDRLTRIQEEIALVLEMSAPFAPVLETPRITVPLALGSGPGCVLLPLDWRSWDDAKLRAALAHETAHLRRHDWSVRLWSLAARSVFWFHPVVWWLEQHLSALAEACCDEEGARSIGDPTRYAGILMEFVRVAGPVRGRLVLAGLAMAQSGVRGSTMKHRLDRILSAGSPGRGVVRGSALTLSLVVALPLIYAAAALQLSAPPTPESWMSELPPSEVVSMIEEPRPVSLKPEEIKRLEQSLLTRPNDEATRGRLIAHYFLNADGENYKRHLFWLIDNLPESSFTCRKSMGLQHLLPFMVTAQDAERAKMMWQHQVSAHSDSAPVLINAAIFFECLDPFLSERWLIQARKLETTSDRALRELVHLYHSTFITFLGDAPVDPVDAFPAHVRQVLASTNDAQVDGLVGQSISIFRPLDLDSGFPQPRRDQIRSQERRQYVARKALAESYLKRAVALDPANPRWQVTLARLQQLNIDELFAEKLPQ